MNDKQRKVLWVTAVVLLLMLLFPPFETPHWRKNAGYGFIANPPQKNANVNVDTLFIQCLIGCAIGAICWFAYKDKFEDTDPETSKELMKVFEDDDAKARAKKLFDDTDPETLIELIGLLQEDDNDDEDEFEETKNK